MMKICPHAICGYETGDIYKGVTPPLEAEYFWTIAVGDSSDCETKESILAEVFIHIKLIQPIISIVALERYPW